MPCSLLHSAHILPYFAHIQSQGTHLDRGTAHSSCRAPVQSTHDHRRTSARKHSRSQLKSTLQSPLCPTDTYLYPHPTKRIVDAPTPATDCTPCTNPSCPSCHPCHRSFCTGTLCTNTLCTSLTQLPHKRSILYCPQNNKGGHTLKHILLSLESYDCKAILRGDLTILLMLKRPRIDPPFICHIYETKNPGRGKVVCEVTCDHIERVTDLTSWKYLRYRWHISDLKIYDTHKELSDFYRECSLAKCDNCPHLQIENTPSAYETWCDCDERLPVVKPPQTWYYVFSKKLKEDTH